MLYFLIILNGVAASVFVLMLVRFYFPNSYLILFFLRIVPQEFLYDPTTKAYGDPSRRPEVRFGTVEYAATTDYMVRLNRICFSFLLFDLNFRLDHLNRPCIYFSLMFHIMPFKPVNTSNLSSTFIRFFRLSFIILWYSIRKFK